MAEYIDKRDLLSIIDERNRNTCNGKLSCLQMKRMIEKIPEAEVAPVRHGHWIDCEDEYSGYVRCSVCGDEFTCWEADCAHTDFCPGCGADMRDGGADNA